jgi:hypothetical protein
MLKGVIEIRQLEPSRLRFASSELIARITALTPVCFQALSFSPFSLLGEGPGMRACEERGSYFFLCSANGEWHSKTKTSKGVDAH